MLMKLTQGRMKWIEDFMAGLMCIGGGVLLATVFIHMLPEVRMSLEEVRDEAGEDSVMAGEFPFAELTLCAGFFVIYLVSISLTFYEQLLRSKIPKAEKFRQVVSILLYFWDLRM